MTAITAAVGPVVLGLLIGVALRRGGLGTAAHGQFLLVLNFYVCLPALVLPSVARARFDRDLLVFPLAAVVMVATGWAIGRTVGRHWAATPQDGAVVTTSFMVVNCAFALPFVGAVHGPAGIVRVAAFDLAHNLLVLTAVLAVAARASPARRHDARAVLGRLLRTPALHAVLLGIGLNAMSWPLPGWAEQSLHPFATASLAVVAIGCGLLVADGVESWRPVAALALARTITAGGVAILLAGALGLTGIDRGVLLMLGLTPVGFVVVTYAATHGLGTRLGSSLLAVSLAISVTAYAAIGLVTG